MCIYIYTHLLRTLYIYIYIYIYISHTYHIYGPRGVPRHCMSLGAPGGGHSSGARRHVSWCSTSILYCDMIYMYGNLTY